MDEQVKEIMLEHLKTLKEVCEECDEVHLNTITNAMISTAEFLTKPKKENLVSCNYSDTDYEE